MVSAVGIESAATSDFLIRMEGVALIAGAGFLLAVRDGTPAQLRLVLLRDAWAANALTQPPLEWQAEGRRSQKEGRH